MNIVGVGIGPGMMTREAEEAIGRAGLIYGSKRSIDLAREYIRPNCQVLEIKESYSDEKAG